MNYKNPFPTVDLIIENKKGEILLIERKNIPYGWALPGGFVDYGESLEHAAQREGKEETNLDIELISPFRAYSDPKRDKRTHTITFVFIAKGRGEPKGMDDAKQAKWFSVSEIKELNIAFDHKKIILDYLEYKKLLKEKALDFQTIGKYLLNG
jgi:ADP-ribose pyrophosphatase YjhB (NUDIX family)